MPPLIVAAAVAGGAAEGAVVGGAAAEGLAATGAAGAAEGAAGAATSEGAAAGAAETESGIARYGRNTRRFQQLRSSTQSQDSEEEESEYEEETESESEVTTSRSRYSINGVSPQLVRAHIHKTLDDIAEDFRQKGEEFHTTDAQKLATEAPPAKPSFPIFMFSVGLAKDILDLPADLTGIGVILASFLGIVLGAILTLWTWNKISGGWWKKAVIKWLWKRLFIAILIEIIPFLQIIPANTIIVLMAFYKEKKIVKLFNGALEKMHASGIMKYIV